MSKYRIMSSKNRDSLSALGFLLPALIATIFVHIIPIAWGIIMSFQGLDITTMSDMSTVPWVGFDNFAEIFTSDSEIGSRFGQSIINVIIYGAVTIPISLVISLCVALLLNRPFKGRTFVRGLVLLPYITPDAVMYNVWRFIFQARIGVVNYLLMGVGFIAEPLVWLVGDRALAAVIIASIWKGWSLACLMFLAGLQNIPEELYEAAKIDGAGPVRSFFAITLPQLWPIISTMLVLSVIWNFHAFNQFYVLLGGDTGSSSAVPNLVIMREAFTNLHYGLGSAMSTLLLAVIMIVVGFLVLRKSKEGVEA